MSQDYEYRARYRDVAGGGVTQRPTEEPSDAGDQARAYRGDCARDGGGVVEIQRRPVGEWETVERWEIPPQPPQSQ